MEHTIRIGTSGWTYPHWKDVFFPADCPKAKWLEYYARHFDTLELNATFYRLPNPKTFENWYTRTPDHFLWAVKANKYITHTKRLNEPGESLERLHAASSGLKEKLGPILFQLPPSLCFDVKVFHGFCQCLHPSQRYVLEVRHPSWICEKAFSMLREYNIALCMADTAGRYPFNEVITADFVYIRLHGSQKLYVSEYSEEELKTWVQKIKDWETNAFVYFDNDFKGHAVKNAKMMKKIMGLSDYISHLMM